MKISRPGQEGSGLNWRAAALLGLITSTFSTVVSTLGAARIGRDAAVDWTVVAAIPLRDQALQAEPSWTVILVGILFHQSADFLWAVGFFGLLGRWTARLRPWTIVLLAVPWAVFTSAAEWLFLVPIFPFRQPIFPLEQPYWLGLWVHLLSSSLYPLFPWLRDRLAGRAPSPFRRFAAVWIGVAAAGTLALAVVAFFGSQGREPPHVGSGERAAYDRSYMRRMAAHHAQGVDIAALAIEKAQDPRLRALANLMAAAQNGEIEIFEQWWASWFDEPPRLPPASPEEHAAMPGMLSPEQIEALRQASGEAFDPLFVRMMTFHHEGAIAMADDAMRRASDPRLKLMSHAIRHEQRGEIELMRGVGGAAAMASAVSSSLAPAGAGVAERRPDGKDGGHGHGQDAGRGGKP
jgi:uncharacterized protein (DUF305 family)